MESGLKIQILKQTETLRLLMRRLDGLCDDGTVPLQFANDNLAVFHIADISGADDIKGAGFRTEDRFAIKLAHE